MKLISKILMGANVAAIMVMLAVGYSGYIDPRTFPLLSCVGLVFPLTLLANLAFVAVWAFVGWRRLVVPVAGFALAYPPLSEYLPLNRTLEAEEGDTVIGIMSYNVHNFAGVDKESGDTPLYNIIRYIGQSDVDVLCLQEASESKGAGEMLDSLFPYCDRLKHKESVTKSVYSKYPVIKSDIIEYDTTDKGSMACWLRMGEDTVIVINNHLEITHLSIEDRETYNDMLKGTMERDSIKAESRRLIGILGESNALRAAQADAIHEYVEAHSGYPIIMCGDFNDHPLSYTHRVMAKSLADCFTERGRGLGISCNLSGFYVRIDNILVSPHFTTLQCKVDNTIADSDHYPIYAKVKKN